MPDVNVVGPASLVVGQVFSAFQSFLPSLAEVRKADAANNPDVIGDVRLGEVAALALGVGVGVILSNLTGSPVPAVVAVLMVLVLLCVYEAALWGDRLGNPKPLVVSRERNDA